MSHNFYVCTHINFTHVNEIEATYERSCINIKVKPRSTFSFPRGLSYITSILFIHVKIIWQWKSTFTLIEAIMLTRLSLSFKAGVTWKISVLKHGQPPCSKGSRGLSVGGGGGGLEAWTPTKFLKFGPQKWIFLLSGEGIS